MNLVSYKKPTPETFKKVISDCGGNLSKAATVFGVSRSTITKWTKEDKEFASIVKDERMRLFDDCVVTARTVAMGVPAYEDVYDENGEVVLDKNGKPKKRFAGWVERPDGQMLRYMMSTLGRTEGFGESPVDESDGTVKSGVPIRAWIMKMNEGEGEEK